MGGGRKWTDDAPMRKPIDLLAEIDRAKKAGGDGTIAAEEGASFCTTEREVPLRLLGGQAVAIGDEVHLAPGATVIRNGTTIGEVTGLAAKAMQACLEWGYRMTGTVTDVDLTAGTGSARIVGHQQAKAA